MEDLVDRLGFEEFGVDENMFGWLNKKKGTISEGVNDHITRKKEEPDMSKRRFLSSSLKGIEEEKSSLKIEDTKLSRRDFLRGVGRGAATAAVVGTVGIGALTYSKDSEAAVSYPPGIARSSRAVKYAWNDITEGKFNIADHYLIPGKQVFNNAQVRKSEMKEDPAIYFCLAYRHGIDTFKFATKNAGLDKDDPMTHFARGIGHYSWNWIRGKNFFEELSEEIQYSQNEMERRIEIPLLKAIFAAANPKTVEARLQQYRSEEVDNERLLINVKTDIDRRGTRERLIAAWASSWLVNHHFQAKNEIKQKQIFDNLEVPLVKKGLRIRGPPHYF